MLASLQPKLWNSTYAAHLLCRAGFEATAEEIDQSVQDGLNATLDRLFAFTERPTPLEVPTWTKAPDAAEIPDRKQLKQGLSKEEVDTIRKKMRQEASFQLTQLRGWWIEQMLHSPHPLQEKLTLFWHGHFATSVEKVRHPYAMFLQNQTLRQFAAGNWEELLVAVSKDPAMLIYLDNAKSVSRSPNENYARELMELFSLGEGHYTEKDIQESARAFTGWSLEKDQILFQERPMAHDNGLKDFMGHAGRFNGDDIIRIIVGQPQSARFIMKKLWSFFAYENPDDSLLSDLAETLRNNKMEFAPTLRSLFASEAFYSPQALHNQVKSPAQWLVGLLKDLDSPAPHPGITTQMLNQLGQSLFQPPNVKGWDGGFAWITAASLVDRYQFAESLIRGGSALRSYMGPIRQFAEQSPQMMQDTNTPAFLEKMTVSPVQSDKAFLGMDHLGGQALAEKLSQRFYHRSLTPESSKRITQFLPSGKPAGALSNEERIRLILSFVNTPMYQLT